MNWKDKLELQNQLKEELDTKAKKLISLAIKNKITIEDYKRQMNDLSDYGICKLKKLFH